MELKQAVTGRFFAALYRWDSFARAPLYSHNSFARLSASTHSDSRRIRRSYAATTFRRQKQSLASELGQSGHHNEEPLGSQKGVEKSLQDTKGVAQQITEHQFDASEDMNGANQNTPAPYHNRSDEDNTTLDAETASTGGAERAYDDLIAKSLRSVMRLVPSSVVILTVASTNLTGNIVGPLGTALSSFNTVSLDPPHVSFNIKFPSRTLDAIRAAKGRFRITFLDDSCNSATIADSFSKGNTVEAFKERQNVVQIVLPDSNDSAPPRLQTKHHVASLECELTQEVTVADHVVLIAKVKQLFRSDKSRSVLAYHDGTYKRNDGTPFVLAQDAGAVTDDANDAETVFGRLPLLYGESERHTLVAAIQKHLEANSRYSQTNVPEALKSIKRELHIPKNALGVNVQGIIAHYLVRHKVSSKLSGSEAFLYPYWGRLTKSQITELVNVVMQLVKKEPVALNLHLFKFLDVIGVHYYSTILPGDILKPLRADKDLAQHVEFAKELCDERIPSLLSWELLEDAVRELFRTKDFNTCLEMTDDEIYRAVGKDFKWVTLFIPLIRERLLHDLFPHGSPADRLDIQGEVTPTEARVVISRVVEALASFRNPQTLSPQSPSYQMKLLCEVGVHPSICGFDVEYVMARLLSTRKQVRSSADFTTAVSPLLEPIFKKGRVEWVDLVSSVKEVVQEHTMQAMQWSREDLLAAMGLDQQARFQPPFQGTSVGLIKTSTLLPIIFAKELRDRYGMGTPEENEAIATYLKANFDYSIKDKRQGLPASVDSQLENGSTDDEARQVMMQNLGIEIPPVAKMTQEFEEAMADFGISRIWDKPSQLPSNEGFRVRRVKVRDYNLQQ